MDRSSGGETKSIAEYQKNVDSDDSEIGPLPEMELEGSAFLPDSENQPQIIYLSSNKELLKQAQHFESAKKRP